VPTPLPDDTRHFVESTNWVFAKTYAATWPHEYVVRTPENASMILALAKHIFERGVPGRFYSQVPSRARAGTACSWDCRRAQVTKVRVVKLRGVAGEALLCAQYLVPQRTLLDPSVLPATHDVGVAQWETLQRFLSEPEALFAPKEPVHGKPTG
jgi:hypothetical protein